MQIYGLELFTACHHIDTFGDTRYYKGGYVLLTCHVISSDQVLFFWVEACHGKSPSCHDYWLFSEFWGKGFRCEDLILLHFCLQVLNDKILKPNNKTCLKWEY